MLLSTVTIRPQCERNFHIEPVSFSNELIENADKLHEETRVITEQNRVKANSIQRSLPVAQQVPFPCNIFS
jgi:hypothetical protein